MRASWLPLVLATLLASCASPRGGGEAAPSAPSREVIATSALPPGHVVTDGREPLHLDIVVGDPLALAPATEADAELIVRFVDRNRERTIVSILSRFEQPLKFDLYISPDGERWQYKSSCPPDSREAWSQLVPYLAIANPRVIASDDRSCH